MTEHVLMALAMYVIGCALAYPIYRHIAAKSAAGRWPAWLYVVALAGWPLVVALLACCLIFFVIFMGASG